MLTEMTEYGFKIEEKAKTVQSEIKKNIQETNSEGKDWDSHQQSGPEGRNKHLTRTE